MNKAILGRKVGMTQVFNEDGRMVPVTVIEAGPCIVVQKKTVETDGYNAIQIGFSEQKAAKVTKPVKGHFDKAGLKTYRYLKEIRVKNPDQYEVGQELKIEDVFSAGEKVDVTGISKGKGFTGMIGFGNQRGPESHGSHYHRGPGTLGALGPNRVFKGRPLPGRKGSDRVTVQNLEVVQADNEKNLLLVKGSVPGAKKSIVMVKDSVQV